MKKFTFALVLLSLVLSLFACETSAPVTDTTAATSTAATTTVPIDPDNGLATVRAALSSSDPRSVTLTVKTTNARSGRFLKSTETWTILSGGDAYLKYEYAYPKVLPLEIGENGQILPDADGRQIEETGTLTYKKSELPADFSLIPGGYSTNEADYTYVTTEIIGYTVTVTAGFNKASAPNVLGDAAPENVFSGKIIWTIDQPSGHLLSVTVTFSRSASPGYDDYTATTLFTY